MRMIYGKTITARVIKRKLSSKSIVCVGMNKFCVTHPFNTYGFLMHAIYTYNMKKISGKPPLFYSSQTSKIIRNQFL